MILQKLKEATSSLHQQTEALANGNRLVSGSISLPAYILLLQANYRIYHALETSFAPWSAWIATHLRSYHDKSPWLREDLLQLEAELPAGDFSGISIENAESLLGCLYVVEGSMLGGRYILKSMKKNPELKHLPHRFFQGYGDQTGPHWKAFTDTCRAFINTPEQEMQTISSAKAAFSFFHAVYSTSKMH